MILSLDVKLAGGAFAKTKWKGVIEIMDTHSLQDLHLAIQDAVDFDCDHLYEFFIAKTPGSRDRFTITDDEEFDGKPDAFEQKVGSLFPLPDKMSLFYLFDYGDDWCFKISLSKKQGIKPIAGVRYPRLVSEVGDKPEQYPDWDDE